MNLISQMKPLHIKIKKEKLFARFSDSKVEPTELGREQFFREQSLGLKPSIPDPYYVTLVRGKTSFDWLCSEYQRTYFSGTWEWWGFLTLWQDWEGERWVLPYLCKWHGNIPKWLSLEISREELKRNYGI